MKKLLVTALLVLPISNIAYAEEIKTEKSSYIEFKLGYGRQIASDIYTSSKSTSTSNISSKEFISNQFSLIYGTDYYQTKSAIPMRTEIDLTIRGSDTIKYKSTYDTDYAEHTAGMKISLNTLMFNVYYDFHGLEDINKIKLTPYVMLGVGGAIPFSITDNITAQSSSSSFYPISMNAFSAVWAAGFGVNMEINPSFTIDIGAKYSQANGVKATFEDSRFAYNPTYSIDSLAALDMNLGFRYNF